MSHESTNREFLATVIQKTQNGISLICQFNSWQELSEIEPESFDVALLFDESGTSPRDIADAIAIPRQKP